MTIGVSIPNQVCSVENSVKVIVMKCKDLGCSSCDTDSNGFQTCSKCDSSYELIDGTCENTIYKAGEATRYILLTSMIVGFISNIFSGTSI